MNLIILGPPGAGKGTQAKSIAEEFMLLHISTGDLFRESITNNTPLGAKAKEYIDKGLLVPDSLTIEILKQKLFELTEYNGFILDGFPRNLEQAASLEGICTEMEIEINAVIDIDTPKDVIVKRLQNRRMCRNCNAIFNINNTMAKVSGKCDICGGELYQRDDDKPEVVLNRLKVYEEQTKPLKEYYRKKNLLKVFNGEKEIHEISREISEYLHELIINNCEL